MDRVIIAVALSSVACSAGGEPIVVHVVSVRSGTPVAGVRVQVDAQPWIITGADGTATFDPVSGSFTVLAHETHVPGVEQVYGLAGDGSDVVVEVSGPGPLQWHEASVTGAVLGRTGSPTSTVELGVAPFRDWSYHIPAPADGTFEMAVPWRAGPDETTATVAVHAWESDGTTPPGHYHGFGSSDRLALVDTGAVTDVAVTLQPVAESTVAATVALPAALTGAQVSTSLWLDFDRYQQLVLVEPYDVPADFELVAPAIDAAATWIGVLARGAWHHRRVSGAAGEIDFSPPAPAALVEPPVDAVVDGDTLFRWSPAEPDGASILYVGCSWMEGTDLSFLGYQLEAEGTEAVLPAVPGVAIAADAVCDFFVEWCASTDPADEERCVYTASRP